MEPPRPAATMIHHNITVTNATASVSNSTHPATVATPVRQTAEWGQSTAADSSMMVGTVGIMALLVGALSARRLRRKSFLAACIENESLEDEAAYDAASTVHYQTFTGFHGDLEKFDV